MLRILRIGVLLYLLAFVATATLIESKEATNWDYALRVVVYPVAADSSTSVRTHVANLTSERSGSAGRGSWVSRPGSESWFSPA